MKPFFTKFWKVNKGKPGYLAYSKLKTGTAMVSGFMLVLLLFFTGVYIFADRKNLFTAGAILSMLPTAKMTVHFLMYPRRGKSTDKEYEELTHLAGNMPVLADMYITPEKKNIELTYATVSKSGIIFFCDDKNLDEAYHGNFIRNFLKKSDITAEVTFYRDFGKFKKRLDTIRKNEPEAYDEKDGARIDDIVRNLLIMSI